jgi:hypothetical protein
MTTFSCGALLFLCAAGPAPTEVHDVHHLLRLLVAKSDLVVTGTVKEDPVGTEDQPGVVTYSFRFKVTDVLKGEKVGKGKLTVAVTRFEQEDKDRLPLLRKGRKCILFLKKERPGTYPFWGTVDYWFSVQRYGPTMAEGIKDWAKEEAKRKDN